MADAALELSLAQIGRHFGISRERARQLEARTKDKLRARLPVLGDGAVAERIALAETHLAAQGAAISQPRTTMRDCYG